MKIKTALVAITLLASSIASAEFKLMSGEVSYISDGDTIHFAPNGATLKKDQLTIRMVGIDTPEMHFPMNPECFKTKEPCHFAAQGEWGSWARTQLVNIAPVGTASTLQNQGLDKYGRTLGRIYKGNTDVNLAMVEVGAAFPYIICTGPTCTADYLKSVNANKYFTACSNARKKGLGIFNVKGPLNEYPWEFRSRMKGEKVSKYVGDIATKKLYPPSEYRKVDVCRAVWFLTQQDGLNAGFN